LVWVVIPAAGRGERLGASVPKQFLTIKGTPLVVYTLKRFEEHPEVSGIVVSTSPDYEDYLRSLVKKYGITKCKSVVPGGETRQESVLNGVKACPEGVEVVLVHDAVRIFVSRDLINRVIKGVYEWGACIPTIPVRDALNEVNEKGKVKRSVDRTGIHQVQTPQGAKLKVLKKCLIEAQAKGLTFPDESSLLMYFGYEVRAVKGEFLNFKVTYQEDYCLAERLIDCKIEASS